MKKLIFAALLAAGWAGTAFAQTSQGSKVISGNLRAYLYDNEEKVHAVPANSQPGSRVSKFGNVSVSPSMGFFVLDKLEVGGSLGMSYSRERHNNNTQGSEYSTNIYSYGLSISPYVRKYAQLTERLMFYGTGYVRAGRTNLASREPVNKVYAKSTNLAAGIGPGLTYFVTDKFALNTSFGTVSYDRTSINPEDSAVNTVEKTFRTDLSLSSFSFGMSYFIPR